MENKIECLAFLQNMWVRNPERVRKTIERDGEEFRRKFMRYALFAGCKTGRILTKIFGEEALERIEFEETTRQISGNPKEIFPADLEHMAAAIKEHQPKIILAFGAIAHNALTQIGQSDYIRAHHPASRHPDTFQNLTTAARLLQEKLNTR